ncbi:hypothetical protein [Paenibacillus wynnii]|uniref:hypothetical protein n=1 Tax=Paenibacillus wynnii TaxID=268407 RepID=UPI0027909478|nr:hypothetical protein [Paenibacillus wynnii]MDQ0194713.1 chromosome segregation ATPase [Paenibacillus wynnii]
MLNLVEQERERQRERQRERERIQNEIREINARLQSVCMELESISGEVEREFKGIGASLCSQKLIQVSGRYRSVINELSQI